MTDRPTLDGTWDARIGRALWLRAELDAGHESELDAGHESELDADDREILVEALDGWLALDTQHLRRVRARFGPAPHMWRAADDQDPPGGWICSVCGTGASERDQGTCPARDETRWLHRRADVARLQSLWKRQANPHRESLADALEATISESGAQTLSELREAVRARQEHPWPPGPTAGEVREAARTGDNDAQQAVEAAHAEGERRVADRIGELRRHIDEQGDPLPARRRWADDLFDELPPGPWRWVRVTPGASVHDPTPAPTGMALVSDGGSGAWLLWSEGGHGSPEIAGHHAGLDTDAPVARALALVPALLETAADVEAALDDAVEVLRAHGALGPIPESATDAVRTLGDLVQRLAARATRPDASS